MFQDSHKIKFCLLQAGVITAFLFGLTGCMLGPDYERPQTAADVNDGYYNTGIYPSEPDKVDFTGWWRDFAGGQFEPLVRRALKNNTDIEEAAAKVIEAEAGLEKARGSRLPQVEYSLGRTRSKNSFNFGGGRFSSLTTSFSQEIQVSYVTDLFGKLRRQQRASWQQLLAMEANRQAVVNTVISSVVKSAVNLAALQKREVLAEELVNNWEKTVHLTKQRYERGLISSVELRSARENLQTAKSQLESLRTLLTETENSLDVLLGRRPGNSRKLSMDLYKDIDLQPVPVGVPAGLLDRRPDVRNAELNLRAANENIGASIAALFPDLTLTGSYGRSADKWRNIWIDETEIYSAVMNLAAPLFRGGSLRADVKISRAQFEQSAAAYAKTVLNAVKEVEDALSSQQRLKDRLEFTNIQLNQTEARRELLSQRFSKGVSDALELLNVKRQQINAESSRAELTGNLLTARVDLILALGGNWVEVENEENYTLKD